MLTKVTHKIIRLKTVIDLTGLSESTLWRREQEGLFPMRRYLGGRAVGWFLDEVIDWVESTERKKPGHSGLRVKNSEA